MKYYYHLKTCTNHYRAYLAGASWKHTPKEIRESLFAKWLKEFEAQDIKVDIKASENHKTMEYCPLCSWELVNKK